MTTMMVQLQNDFREFMMKQDAFVNRMVCKADKKNECSNLQFRLLIAKAMGDAEEMRKIMEHIKKLELPLTFVSILKHMCVVDFSAKIQLLYTCGHGCRTTDTQMTQPCHHT